MVHLISYLYRNPGPLGRIFGYVVENLATHSVIRDKKRIFFHNIQTFIIRPHDEMTIYDTLCTGQLVLLLLKFSSNYETLSTKEKLVERTISIRMNVLNEMNSDYFCKKRVNSNHLRKDLVAYRWRQRNSSDRIGINWITQVRRSATSNYGNSQIRLFNRIIVRVD